MCMRVTEGERERENRRIDREEEEIGGEKEREKEG